MNENSLHPKRSDRNQRYWLYLGSLLIFLGLLGVLYLSLDVKS